MKQDPKNKITKVFRGLLGIQHFVDDIKITTHTPSGSSDYTIGKAAFILPADNPVISLNFRYHSNHKFLEVEYIKGDYELLTRELLYTVLFERLVEYFIS